MAHLYPAAPEPGRAAEPAVVQRAGVVLAAEALVAMRSLHPEAVPVALVAGAMDWERDLAGVEPPPGGHPPVGPLQIGEHPGPGGTGESGSVENVPGDADAPGPPEGLHAPRVQVVSDQNLTGRGETVLGPFNNPMGGSSYVDLARDRGASYFDIGDAWNSYTQTQRLAANQHVLDIASGNGDTIKLSIPVDMVPDGSYTAAELRYLRAHGHTVVDGYTLIPPKAGGESWKYFFNSFSNILRFFT
jgi:hypothetical protein